MARDHSMDVTSRARRRDSFGGASPPPLPARHRLNSTLSAHPVVACADGPSFRPCGLPRALPRASTRAPCLSDAPPCHPCWPSRAVRSVHRRKDQYPSFTTFATDVTMTLSPVTSPLIVAIFPASFPSSTLSLS